MSIVFNPYELLDDAKDIIDKLVAVIGTNNIDAELKEEIELWESEYYGDDEYDDEYDEDEDEE